MLMGWRRGVKPKRMEMNMVECPPQSVGNLLLSIVPAMDNDMPILGRAAVPGRRVVWGHTPSLQTAGAIIYGRDNR